MRPSEIDLMPFRKAIQRLEEGMATLAVDPHNTLLRDGVIQRFEFTYELSHETLKRFLEFRAANPEEVAGLSFQDLIRVGGEMGLVRSPWKQWRSYRHARTDTRDTYDESKALQVLAVLPDFLSEAHQLLQNLEASRGPA